VGSGAPHLIRGFTDLPWRHTLLAASLLAGLGALAVTLVTEGPHRFPPARFDLRMATAVLRERGPRLACFGYFGHMWELYAMWAWLATFLAASLEVRGGGSYAGLNASAATFACAGLAGGLGAWAGGALADRWGRTALTMAAMAVSGLCAVLIGLTFGGPPLVTLLVAVVWGVTVIADSAQFSTAVTELAPAAYVGTALTSQTCLGFALTMVSIWLIPPVVAWAGWRWAFAMLAIGPALGVAAMARLRTLPEARLMASGRR
jgi:MFS family permease